MTMNIFMESCISCFFFRQLRNAGHRSQVQVRVQVTMLRYMNNTKPVFYNVALITIRNKI